MPEEFLETLAGMCLSTDVDLSKSEHSPTSGGVIVINVILYQDCKWGKWFEKSYVKVEKD